MVKKRIFPLKYKLITLVCLILTGSITAYMFFAINLFQKDKKAYLFENSQLLTTNISTALESHFSQLKLEILSQHKLTLQSEKQPFLTKKMNPNIIASFYRGKSSQIIKNAEQNVLEITELQLKKLLDIPEHFTIAKGSTYALKPLDFTSKEPLLSFSFKVPSTNEYVQSIIKLNDIYEIIVPYDSYQTIVTNKDKQIIFNSKPKESLGFIKQLLTTSNDLENYTKIYTSSTKEKWVVSQNKIETLSLNVVSFIPQKKAFIAITVLTYKSVLFAGLLLFFFSALTIIFSKKLTYPLQNLFLATQKISKGNFDIQLKSQSNDEIGNLSQSFNTMSKEVLRLIEETKDKAILEKELETAQMVQDMLFPKEGLQTDHIQLVSHFSTATQCGGDWCDYFYLDNKIYCLLGDATGHGAAAALVTAAAQSAITTFKTLHSQKLIKNDSPDFLMSLLNQSICHATQGKIKMTFVILSIDLDTETISHCNASHEWPFISHNGDSDLSPRTRKNMDTFDGHPGPPLGQSLESEYSSLSSPLSHGDTILLYTDGLTEQRNTSGEEWGERRLLKTFTKSSHQTPLEIKENLLNQWNQFSQNSEVLDDVTFMVFKYNAQKQILRKAG